MTRFIAACFCLLMLNTTQAKTRLPRIIRDSMVLQRNAAVHIWGWANPREQVRIAFNGKIRKTITRGDGSWVVEFPAMPAGDPFIMKISGDNTIVLHDILLGDVWVCAGQSNMEHQMKLHAEKYKEDIRSAHHSAIRQFKVPNGVNLSNPEKDLTGGVWKWANPGDVSDFSAVAYFFARSLFEKYQVPIGIINVSWGGIPIEAAMSEDILKTFPSLLSRIERNKDSAYVNETNRNALAARQAGEQPEDEGFRQRWFDTSYIAKGWLRVAVPGYWSDQGAKDLNGIVWYRREIDLPASVSGDSAMLLLGRIVDADELFINGVRVGSTGYMYPQRRYQVRSGILKSGKNLFVVRITNLIGKGGFVPDKPYQLIVGNDSFDLTGYWQYKPGMVKSSVADEKPHTGITLQNQPTAVFNGMLAPVIPYTIAGFLWYQGESNTAAPDLYAKLQPALIADWREKWSQGNLPFLFVQLPGFGDYHYLPTESQWAAFREAQAQTLSVPLTAMAVAIDLGEWNDVHPDAKKEVGDRLALAASALGYHEQTEYEGPRYQSSAIAGNKIIVSFLHAGGGLVTRDGEPPAEFAIAGADKHFVWAKTKIEDNHVVAWNDEIPEPKFLRYAWSDQPVNPNLYNKENLPAAPFRTDR